MKRGRGKDRLDWSAVLEAAAEIVVTYDIPPTLRQLFYRLVAMGAIPNTTTVYKMLSSRTAKARREGAFPALVDLTREIRRDPSWTGPRDALEALQSQYRRDRTEGQAWAVYLGVEKHALVRQLETWFSEYGVPILALGGYSSQTYVDEVAEDIRSQDRPAVLVYGGDFDPSGLDIQRDFAARVGVFEQVQRVALTWDQVLEHELPPQPGKATDSRAARFVERHGELVQVELDALSPEVLHQVYLDALTPMLDVSTWASSMDREREDRRRLAALLEEPGP
ncbi:MAG: hypothetical protein ACREMD_00855 [Gemmatimonadota bacterium]